MNFGGAPAAHSKLASTYSTHAEPAPPKVAVAFTAISPVDQESIVRYNFQVERSRRRKAVEGEGQHTEFSGEMPALTLSESKDLARCPIQVSDFVELSLTLPLEVPAEIRVVARVVRLESGDND